MTPPGVPARRAVARDALGVGIATGAYGISFGAVSVAAGLSVAQTCALSLLMFTGASQFALVGVVAAGGAPVAAGATALLLGSRNLFYGVRLAPLLGWRGPRRAAAAHVLIDESTAMSLRHAGGTTAPGDAARARARWAFVSTGVSVFVWWNLATLAGALTGEAAGDPRRYGLDAAVAAAFLALLWPQLRGRRALQTAVGGAALALVLVPATPAGVPVLAAAAVAVLAGALAPVSRPEDS